MCTPLDSPHSTVENRPPVPLKHSTETALMILLGLVIAATSLALSLLPGLPGGIFYWTILFGLSVVYPLLVTRMLRENRAEYEFRSLHWFPGLILLAWFFLELAAPHAWFALILKLGFLYLWSLPLVFLGVLLLILFALHIIRRSRTRVAALSVLLVLFTIGALLAERNGWNDKLRTAFFPETNVSKIASSAFTRLARAARGLLGRWSPSPAIQRGTEVAVLPTSVARSSSLSSVSYSASSEGLKKVQHLAKSGLGLELMLLPILALYTYTLHVRSRKRMLVRAPMERI